MATPTKTYVNEQALTPDHYATLQQRLAQLPAQERESMISRSAETPWQEAKAGLIGPRCLPEQNQNVRLRLASGEETTGRLTWAYRWLLEKGGGVKRLQEVTHWWALELTKTEAEAWWAQHNFGPTGRNNCAFQFPTRRQVLEK